ncbi:MAG: PIN domain-containing protein [Pseudomonadota bacterium]
MLGYFELVYRVLIDTCVWLDLAKDARNLPILSVLDDLQRSAVLELVVPEIVQSEFERNKDRVSERAQKSLKSHFRLLRESIVSLSKDLDTSTTLDAISEVDRRIKVDSQDVTRTVLRIEGLFAKASKPALTTQMMENVTRKALESVAPFHLNKNSVADALLLELYADLLETKCAEKDHFAFVTHNVRDFGRPNGDRREPHQDLVDLFSDERSSYWNNLASLLEEIAPDLVEDTQMEFSGWDQARKLSEILDAENTLYRQIWYNRHLNLRASIDDGTIKIVSAIASERGKYRTDQISKGTWEIALAAAERTEKELGTENLGPWDDFEWGMLNGKLSALRWVLGDDWDMLDT